MDGIKVYEITQDMFDSMAKLQDWQCTRIAQGEAIEAHEHNEFEAMYFTKDVKKLYSAGEAAELPQVAAVFVARGTQHAWSGVKAGTLWALVGHFHEGHGVHAVTSEY